MPARFRVVRLTAAATAAAATAVVGFAAGWRMHPAPAASAPAPPTTSTLPAVATGRVDSPLPVRHVTVADPAAIVTPGQNVPNPFVVYVKGRYYMFASQPTFFSQNIQLRKTSNPLSWGPVVGDAMPTLPAWANPGFTWSPDVREVAGRWVMWFTAQVKGYLPTTQCIGAAVSVQPWGPYAPEPTPIICQLDHHGSIDPRSFVDADGSLWMDWKSDDNADVAGNEHSIVYASRMAPDGLALTGPSVPILTADQPWEGRIVEAPQMVLAENHYWLFYSGNWFNQPYYGLGVAECAGPAGPCTKPLNGPWLSSDAQGAGPGECSLYEDLAGWHMVYSPLAVRFRTPTSRPVAMTDVVFGPEGPTVRQPVPPPGTAQPKSTKSPIRASRTARLEFQKATSRTSMPNRAARVAASPNPVLDSRSS